MSKIKIFISMFFFIYIKTNYPLEGVVDTFKGLGNGIVAMGQGFAAQGGYLSSSQKYSFQVFNNSTIPVKPQVKKIKMILGAPTNDGIGMSMVLNPGSNSGTNFYKTKLYFDLEIVGADFTEGHTSMGAENDPNIYLYNVYENKSGVHAELVGSNLKKPTLSSDFIGMIYNGSSSTFPLTFCLSTTSDYAASLTSTLTVTTTITIPLEPDTFHTLQSQDNMMLRPSTFTYPNGSLIISEQGLGISSPSTLIPTQTVVGPMTYNYEVLPNNKLVQTGFSVGNYKQPVNGKIRSINPVLYTIWHASSADLKISDTTNNLVGLTASQKHSTWALYTGSIFSTKQKKMIEKPLIKIPLGKAISFYIIRPPISKRKDILYIFDVSAPDDVAAQELLSQFFTIPIPRFIDKGISFESPTGLYSYTLPNGINSDNAFAILNNRLPEEIGQFSKNRASAYIIFQKTFSSYSTQIKPCFCTVQPPLYSPLSILSSIIQYFDPVKTTDEIKNKLIDIIPEWIDLSINNFNEFKKQVTEYLIQYGSSELITKQNPPTLNFQGESALNIIINGPGNISNIPLLYTVSNDVTGYPPTPWVDQKDVIPF